MNKNSTQILIAILCFAGSGMVMYYGYFKPQAASKQLPPPAIGSPGALAGKDLAAKENEPILPLNKLTETDLKPLKKINGDSYANKYPKLDPKTEVGVDVKDLIPFLPQAED